MPKGGKRRGAGRPRKLPLDGRVFRHALEDLGVRPEERIAELLAGEHPCQSCDETIDENGSGRTARTVSEATFLQQAGLTDPDAFAAAAYSDSRYPCMDCRGRGTTHLPVEGYVKLLVDTLPYQFPRLKQVDLHVEGTLGPSVLTLNHEADSAKARLTRKLLAAYEAASQIRDVTPAAQPDAIEHEPVDERRDR